MPFSILLLTPGQPSSNPRLVKEALSLVSRGYNVTVLYCHWVDWADRGDEELQQQYPYIRWIRVGGHPAWQKGIYWYTRIRHKIYRVCAGIFPGSLYFQQRAHIRCYRELKRASAARPAQLYIAHNLGALAPAAQAAKRNHALYAFDAEDYHRGQYADDDAGSISAKVIEDHYIPGVAYLTAASPLIGQMYKQHYPQMTPIIVNNVFSLEFIRPVLIPYKSGEQLRLFWFSQTVGTHRGLETMIEAIGRLQASNVTCSILGLCSEAEKQRLLSLAASFGVQQRQLQFIDPVPPDEVFMLAASHHIGIASESNWTLNRRLALANKLFTYPLAGLTIIATDTPAQKDFIQRYPGIGQLYADGDPASLASLLKTYLADPGMLHQLRLQAWNYAKTTLNWEQEQVVLMDRIATVLEDKV